MGSEDSTAYTIRPGISLTGASQIDSGQQWTQITFKELETADSNSRLRFRIRAFVPPIGSESLLPRIEVHMVPTANVRDPQTFKDRLICYYVLTSLPDGAIKETLENLVAIWDYHRESPPQVRQLEMMAPFVATMGDEIISPPFVLDADDDR